MRNQIKLKAGEIGSFEFTFFLKTLLPSTSYRTNGYFEIHISPPFITYSQTTDGILKCYFFFNVISADCTVSSNTLYTIFTVYTPEEYDYKESEIPVSITTEGAPSNRDNGFEISKLV